MPTQAFGSILHADGTGTRLPGVHNYHALTHKNARFLSTRRSSVSSLLGCPPVGRREQQLLLPSPKSPTFSLEGSAAIPRSKGSQGAPVRADPPLRDPAFLPFPRSAPPGHHAPLLLDRDAVSIFEYPCVVTAMTSLRITGESRA